MKLLTMLMLCLAAPPEAKPQAAKPIAVPPASAELERVRAALQVIEAATEAQDQVQPLALVRSSFPGSRSVLHEALERGSAKSRCVVLQVLGELGEEAHDLKPVTNYLEDANNKVRLAAIMAVRRLGSAGHDALVQALARETVPTNRKMAVKSMQVWALDKSVPVLVGHLRKEKEKSVRNFVVTALEAITKQKLGDNVAAWEAHLETKALSVQAKSLAAKRPPEPSLPPEASPPGIPPHALPPQIEEEKP